jgi:hypothetical protein
MPAAIAYAGAYLLMSTEAVALGAFLLGNAAVIGTGALILGGLAYSSYKARQAKDDAKNQYNAAQVDRLATVSSAVAPRDLVLGRVRKAGTVFYRNTTGANSQDLYLAIALAGHELDAIEQIYLNDLPVTLDGAGQVTSAPYYSTSTLTASGTGSLTPPGGLPATYVAGSLSSGTYAGGGDADTSYQGWSYQYTTSSSAVQITAYLGAAGQTADPALQAAFPADWTSANTVAGVAYLVVKLSYSETAFPSGVPNVSAVVRGARVYDPRSGSTAWSQNPALLLRHVYSHPRFGKASVKSGEDTRLIAAANACDAATVYTVAGVAQPSRALYTAALVAPFGTAPRSLFDDLAQAMGGSWAFGNGELFVKAGSYSAPVMALTDADLAVIQRNGASETQRPISISVHKERANKFNSVKPTIYDPAQDYKQSALTTLSSAALLARDGVELVQAVTMPAVNYAPQALHVAGILMRDARDPLLVELPFKLRVYPVELFDTVSLTLARYGWSAKTFMVLGRAWAADGSIALTLKETSAAIVTMDAGFSAQGFAPNTNLGNPWQVSPPTPLTLTSGSAELLRQNDGTVVSRLRISWPQISNQAVRQAGRIELQYRDATSTGPWASLVVPGDETQVVTSEVLDGASYLVRARARTSLALSDWGLQQLHTVVGKTAPPSDVASLAYTQETLGLRLSWPPITDLDAAAYQLRTGGSAWGVGDTALASVSASSFLWAIQTSGSLVVRIKAIDTSGNLSLNATATTVIIAGPSAPGAPATGTPYTVVGVNETLAWSIPTSGFAIDRYEVRYGASYAAGTRVDTTKATSLTRKVDYSGARTYWVAAIDVAGNTGSATAMAVSISAPGLVQNLRADVVDNNALIFWAAPASGNLPIDRYEVRKGATFAGGSVIGSNASSTFTTVFEQLAGNYTYWVAAVDSAGTVGSASSVVASINQPPDYVLRTNIDSAFGGTRVNALLSGSSLLVPVNTSETWSQHFANNGYASPQAQISAGNPLYISPSLTTASYQEVVDYGSTLPSTTISVTLNSTLLAGTVSATAQIDWSNTSATGPWTSAPAAATSALATSFRWVRITYSFAASAGANLLQVNGLNIKLSVKQRTDSGAGTSAAALTTVGGVSAYWATVSFGYAFVAADCPVVQANTSTARIPIIVYVGGVNPTGFSVAFVNTSGANVASVPFSWTARGY